MGCLDGRILLQRPFFQHIFTKHLLCARHCSRHWKRSNAQNRQKSQPSWTFHSRMLGGEKLFMYGCWKHAYHFFTVLTPSGVFGKSPNYYKFTNIIYNTNDMQIDMWLFRVLGLLPKPTITILANLHIPFPKKTIIFRIFSPLGGPGYLLV